MWWRCDQNGPPARRDEGAYLNRYVTEEQRSRRPIFIATLRAARLLTDCFVAHRSKTTAGILPLRFAHPAKIRSSATTPATDWVHYGETVRRFGVSAFGVRPRSAGVRGVILAPIGCGRMPIRRIASLATRQCRCGTGRWPRAISPRTRVECF